MITDGRDIDKDTVGAILEKFHEKLLIGWIVNDGKTHTVPSHGTDDGCTDEAAQSLYNLLVEAVMGAIKDETGRTSPYSAHPSNSSINAQIRNELRAEIRTQTKEVLTRLFNIDGRK